MLALDRRIHEPARLAILTVLAAADRVDFLFLQQVTGLSKGNLSSHARKLEEAGYLDVFKQFQGRIPVTRYSLTDSGRQALEEYRRELKALL